MAQYVQEDKKNPASISSADSAHTACTTAQKGFVSEDIEIFTSIVNKTEVHQLQTTKYFMSLQLGKHRKL